MQSGFPVSCSRIGPLFQDGVFATVKRPSFKRFRLYVSGFMFLVSSCSFRIAEIPRLNLKLKTLN
jgi:hypothetical protein